MSLTNMKKATLAVLITAGLLAATSQVSLAEVPLPDVPKAREGVAHCVEDTTVMRRKHYTFIKHQRDDTMYDGIRTSKHAFTECIACHVQPRSDGSFPSHEDPDHFCSSCHNYAAVKVDCFDCHADKDIEGAAGK